MMHVIENIDFMSDIRAQVKNSMTNIIYPNMFSLLSSTHVSLQDSRARINNSMDNATEPFPGQTVVERALGVVHGEERQVVYVNNFLLFCNQ